MTTWRSAAAGVWLSTGPHPTRRGHGAQRLGRSPARPAPVRGPRHAARGTAAASRDRRGVAPDAAASLAPCGPPPAASPGPAALHGTGLACSGAAWSDTSRALSRVSRPRCLSTTANCPGLLDGQARGASACDGHGNAARATLKLVRAADWGMPQGQAPQVCSMASWKPCQCNERLLDVFMEHFALDPTGVKNQACYETLRAYGAIAA